MIRRARLARAATSRRPLFARRFDDIVLMDGRIVVVPAVAMSLPSKRFADYVLAMVPRRAWITFRFGGGLLEGPEQTAFMEAMMKIWPKHGRREIKPEFQAIGTEMLHEFIKLLTTKAPGAINAAFGGIFGSTHPVQP